MPRGPWIGWLAFVTVGGCAVALAGNDLVRRKLPNPLVVVLAGSAMIVVAGSGIEGGMSPMAALVAAIGATAVALMLYSRGLVAAGDVKIMGSAAALVTWMGAAPALVYLATIIIGAGVALWWLVSRRHRPEPPTVPLGAVALVGLVPAALVHGPGRWLG